MTKDELRQIYLAKQKGLSDVERKQKSEQIANWFFRNFDLESVRFLHCFIAIEKNNEIDTAPIFRKIWRDFPFITTVAARVDFGTMMLESVKYGAATKLVPNKWRILEPSERLLVKETDIDLVLVPLLCFDKSGGRVGYGKGFYDRFLKTCRRDVLKIGLSYFPPVGKITDAQGFDVKLDFCVTPEEVFNAATPKRRDGR